MGYVCHPFGLRIITKLLGEINTFCAKMKIDLDKMCTQAEAAEIRGVSLQAINHLVKRSRLRSIKVAGMVLLFRSEVEKFTPDVGGRPKKNAAKKGKGRKL